MGEIDFSKGGYEGGDDENFFKPITIPNMEYWWQFREVLRSGQDTKDYWQTTSGNKLSDPEQKELVALSLIHYAVHTGIIESYLFFDEMHLELSRLVSPFMFMQVRRYWKSSYSSLYSSFNALCNIVYVLLSNKSVFGDDPTKPWNYTPKGTINFVNGKGEKVIHSALIRCQKRLDIRNHLDHYWAIWLKILPSEFKMDENFEKGYIALNPERINYSIDAQKRLYDDIFDTMKDFNTIYRELSIKDGFLDKFLKNKSWKIDYTNYQPHGGKRPVSINGE